jgi:hypothetical protein
MFPARVEKTRSNPQQADNCKAIAKRAKLKPGDFWLHKFRANVRDPAISGAVWTYALCNLGWP